LSAGLRQLGSDDAVVASAIAKNAITNSCSPTFWFM
jgi:hypothetical protein